MLQQELLALLPIELRYERIPLAEDANALGPWLTAIDKYVEPPDDTPGLSVVLYGCCEDETPPTPTADDWRRLDEWVAANAETFRLLDEGISRGRLQFPPRLYSSWTSHPNDMPLVEWGDVSRLLRIRAKRALQRADASLAAADGLRLLHLSDLLLRGEGAVINLLIAISIRSAAMDLLTTTAQAGLPAACRLQIEQAIAGSADMDAAAQSALRIDLCEWGLSTLELLPQTNDVGELLDALVPIFYDSVEQVKGMAAINEEACPDDDVLQFRAKQRRRLLELLLAGHPQLFDKAATARLMGEMLLDHIEDLHAEESQPARWTTRLKSKLRRRWRPAPDELLETAWPYALLPSFELEEFGDDAAAVAKRTETTELMSNWPAAMFAMPTDAQLVRNRKLLQRIDNPIGRMVAETLASISINRDLAERCRNELQRVRQALAATAAA